MVPLVPLVLVALGLPVSPLLLEVLEVPVDPPFPVLHLVLEIPVVLVALGLPGPRQLLVVLVVPVSPLLLVVLAVPLARLDQQVLVVLVVQAVHPHLGKYLSEYNPCWFFSGNLIRVKLKKKFHHRL